MTRMRGEPLRVNVTANSERHVRSSPGHNPSPSMSYCHNWPGRHLLSTPIFIQHEGSDPSFSQPFQCISHHSQRSTDLTAVTLSWNQGKCPKSTWKIWRI
ncbi:hypothetical protein SRHO_G00054070 [Serrasalmus rhombeus]